jgi:chaperonin GroES
VEAEEKRHLHVVGDRVLISPEDGENRTRVGLYLPPSAVEAQQVQSGTIVATGPGDPVVDLAAYENEPWRADERALRHRPMQARVGDVAIFFRKAAIEVTWENRTYLVVPQQAILVLLRREDGDVP